MVDLEIADLADAIGQANLKYLGRTRLVESFLEIFTGLVSAGLMTQSDIIYPEMNIPANTTIEFDFPVPMGYYAIEVEDRYVIGQDHALSMLVYKDNVLVQYDPDMVQVRYQTPRNYFTLGSLVTIKNLVQIIVTNNTNVPVYFSVESFSGSIEIPYWNAVLQNYLNVLTKEIGVPGASIQGGALKLPVGTATGVG